MPAGCSRGLLPLLYLLGLLNLLTPRGNRSPTYSPICPVCMLTRWPPLGTEMAMEVATA